MHRTTWTTSGDSDWLLILENEIKRETHIFPVFRPTTLLHRQHTTEVLNVFKILL